MSKADEILTALHHQLRCASARHFNARHHYHAVLQLCNGLGRIAGNVEQLALRHQSTIRDFVDEQGLVCAGIVQIRHLNGIPVFDIEQRFIQLELTQSGAYIGGGLVGNADEIETGAQRSAVQGIQIKRSGSGTHGTITLPCRIKLLRGIEANALHDIADGAVTRHLG